eukprot:Gb_06875 [translate_table: standard]
MDRENTDNAFQQLGMFVRPVFAKGEKHNDVELCEQISPDHPPQEDVKAERTDNGTVDRFGRPAIKAKTGGWKAASFILVIQGLATLAFFGVGVNLVLFLTRVLQQSNASAANNVSKWTGTVYIFSLVGAFLSDAYWGRYRTCTVFLIIFLAGLSLLALSSQLFLLKPSGCGNESLNCQRASTLENAVFYLSIYLVALGNGGYQPSIATFGADQFDEEDPVESSSKVSFFSWFYLALNLGSLFSNTILEYFEDKGMWPLGFWLSTGAAGLSLVIFLLGTPLYRHHKPGGNPLPRVAQVFVAATRKSNLKAEVDKLYELPNKESAINGSRKILHSDGFRFLDKAGIQEEDDVSVTGKPKNPWRLCTVTQGAAMDTTLGRFSIPPASMSTFDILSVVAWVMLYRRILVPWAFGLTGNPVGFSELQRMGVGLIVGMLAMVAAGIVELERLRGVNKMSDPYSKSSLSIFWQIPQYVLIGASEVFMYVGQLEFFNGQSPDALRSFGSALCMTSISFGNYVSSFLVTIVMDITKRENSPGWIPGNLNRGHMDRFYFLLAALTAIDFIAYVVCARWYKCIALYKETEEDKELQKI